MEIQSPNGFYIKTLRCIECGKEFVFSVGEQKFFFKKGYDDPKRCPSCRSLRKQQLEGGSDNAKNI